MKNYNGGVRVPKGVYLNLRNGEFIQLYGQVRVLPGGGDVRYIRVPAALAVIAGPLAGLAFVIFLPLVGIIGIGTFFVYKAREGALALVHKVFQRAAAEPELGMAYITPKGTRTEAGEGKGKTNGEHLGDENTRPRQPNGK